MKTSTADGKCYVYLAAEISALGGILFGYDIGVISGAILFIKKDFSLSAGTEEIVVSSVLLGSLARAVGRGILADRLGRRKLLIVTAGVFGLGAIGAALAPGTAWLIIARVVAGDPIGVASFVARSTFPRLPQLTSVESWFQSIKSLSAAASSSPISWTTPLPVPNPGAGCSRWR